MIKEITNPTSAGLILADKGGNTLVVQQYGKSWSFPKGRIEDGEYPMQTASRELREETGYNRPMPKEGEKANDSVVGFPMNLGQPYSIDITRPTFTGNGWAGEPKCIRYYLATVNSLRELDLSGERDDAITDVRIVNYVRLKKMVFDMILHPEEFMAFGKLIEQHGGAKSVKGIGEMRHPKDALMTLNTELEDFRPLKIAYQKDQFTERPFKTGWGWKSCT